MFDFVFVAGIRSIVKRHLDVDLLPEYTISEVFKNFAYLFFYN